MKVTINTSNGVSKLIFDGYPLVQLNEDELESLRADIYVALQEIDLVKELVRKYEEIN